MGSVEYKICFGEDDFNKIYHQIQQIDLSGHEELTFESENFKIGKEEPSIIFDGNKLGKLSSVIFHVKKRCDLREDFIQVTAGNSTVKMKLNEKTASTLEYTELDETESSVDQLSSNPRENVLATTDKNHRHIITFMIIFVIICLFFYMIPQVTDITRVFLPESHQYRKVKEFERRFEDINMMFPGQYDFPMRMLRNAGIRHLERVFAGNQDDLRPSSFLLVSFGTSNNLANCFARKLAESYTHGNVKEIDCGEFSGEGDTKLRLDNTIKASLQSQKVVVVQNIEKLSFVACQLFMTYADEYNDVATFPQSTIIMTANVPLESEQDRKSDQNKIASYFRDILWKGQATTDSIAALWTRVGDGLGVLKEVDRLPCTQKRKEEEEKEL